MTKIQLFILLQDTIMHITNGLHLSGNYHHVKSAVIDMFEGYRGQKRLPSKKLLVLIGEVYSHYGWQEEFNDYMFKCEERHQGLCEMYDDMADKMFAAQKS